MEEETNKRKATEEAKIGFGSLSEDIVEKILRKLPALSFASAACVSKSWYQNCNRILARPKLASAISLNPSPDIAVQEVLDKVLSEPIRPHFAIANGFGRSFCMQETLDFLAGKLGSKTPLIVTWANGIMGRDALTNEFREVMEGEADSEISGEYADANSGILLTVGFVPGLKVEAIPLLRSRIKQAPQVSMADNFVMDIRSYTTSASGCMSPVGIIMFGGGDIDLKLIIEKLDYAMSKETIIAGDEYTNFLFRSGIESRNVCRSTRISDAITLVFARDRDKPQGIGEIQFHAALSNGLSAIGPRYKAASVRVRGHAHTTWLTARREGQQDILDGQMIVNGINDELENDVRGTDLYIGVTKHRKCSVGTEKSKLMSSLAFHGVMGADEEHLIVFGAGIRTADYFQFYHSDSSTALSSCHAVSANLKNLKLDWSCKNGVHLTDVGNKCKKECIGGFIFSCSGRGESFFKRPNVDSSPFLENFPEVPLAGIFCGGEIGRGISVLNAHEGQEESTPSCVHVYSTVYLIMTYAPATNER